MVFIDNSELYVPQRIKADIHVTDLSRLLARIAELACGSAWQSIPPPPPILSLR